MFPVLILAMGIAMVDVPFGNAENTNSPPAFFGWIFIIFPAIFILCGLALALCIAIAGRQLAHNRRYIYCLAIAGIECIFIPFGTVLGVFTIIVLMRPTVKELFGVAQIDEP